MNSLPTDDFASSSELLQNIAKNQQDQNKNFRFITNTAMFARNPIMKTQLAHVAIPWDLSHGTGQLT